MNTSTTASAPRAGNGNMNPYSPEAVALMESVLIKGDLSKLTPEQRSKYYMTVCNSVGLNPLTKPFEYITLNGRLTLYALRNCTDQLRTLHGVSVVDMAESEREGVYIVTCKVANRDGRTDMAKGAVNINGLKGEALANAMMKSETKSKRRATLSLCGLGFLDETEIEDIPAPVKTLPKKDSRDIYSKMQAEIDASSSRAELRTWGEEAKARIEVLKPDWQDHLRLRFSERMVDLGQHEKRQPPVDPQSLVPGESVNPDTGEVIWDEPPEVDPLDLPACLRRTPDNKVPLAFDSTDWRRDAESALAACTEPSALFDVRKSVIVPAKGKAFPPDWEAVEIAYRKTYDRLSEEE